LIHLKTPSACDIMVFVTGNWICEGSKFVYSALLSPFTYGKVAPVRDNKTHQLGVIGLFVVFCLCAIPAFGIDSTQVTLQPQALNYAGTYALRKLHPELTGSGVNIAVVSRSMSYIEGRPQNDYQFSMEHDCFRGKTVSFHDSGLLPGTASAHSTAVGAVLIGEDPNGLHPLVGRFNYQGAAPKATLDVYEFWYFVTRNVFFANLDKSDLMTMSIGSQFEDWWTRGIESLAEHQGLMVIAGIGNGSNVYDPVLFPAAGANVLGVGVVDSVDSEVLEKKLANFSLPHAEHSSSGPTADGRCKPDIVVPGNCLAADFNIPCFYQETGSWSSFSAPVTAGTLALLVQKAKNDSNLAPAISTEGGNCVLKAILMSSAKKLPFWHKGLPSKDDDHIAPLDYSQGAGLLNAVGAYETLVAGPLGPGNVGPEGWDNNLLNIGNKAARRTYRVRLSEPQDKFITATLFWNKHYSRIYPFEPLPEKNSNLRLELWGLDVKDVNNTRLLDYSDSLVDNVEHIHCLIDANYTNYDLVISFSDTHQQNQDNGIERYAFAWKLSEAEQEKGILWYDLNADGIVNNIDLTILMNSFSKPVWSQDGYLLGDITMDGTIDSNDLQILARQHLLKSGWYEED